MNFDHIETEWWEFNVPCDWCGDCGPHTVLLADAKGSGHDLVECQCGLRFFTPRLSYRWMRDSLVEKGDSTWEAINCRDHGTLTGPHPSLSAEQMHEHLRVFGANIYSRAKAYSRDAAPKIYEVGASIGWLLHACLQNGASPLSGGCEAGPGTCEIGAQVFGVKLDAGMFLDVVPPHAPYDVILMNDMIEHTYTPHADLKKARSIARLGAVFYLKTFIDDLDEPKGRTMLQPPWHAFHFTRVTLRRAIEEAGWHIAAWEEEPAWSQVSVYATGA